jgi:hypothetical protein
MLETELVYGMVLLMTCLRQVWYGWAKMTTIFSPRDAWLASVRGMLPVNGLLVPDGDMFAWAKLRNAWAKRWHAVARVNTCLSQLKVCRKSMLKGV